MPAAITETLPRKGSEVQRAHYFEEVLKGKRFGNAFSETGTKNVEDFQTKIEPDGSDFLVNGKKFYSTGALFADYIPTAAVNAEKKGLLVIIPRETPGLTVIDDWSGFGQRITASGSVVLENVRVKSDWIVPAYKAFDRPTLTGPLSQIIQAAIDGGIARAALIETVRFLWTTLRKDGRDGILSLPFRSPVTISANPLPSERPFSIKREHLDEEKISLRSTRNASLSPHLRKQFLRTM